MHFADGNYKTRSPFNVPARDNGADRHRRSLSRNRRRKFEHRFGSLHRASDLIVLSLSVFRFSSERRAVWVIFFFRFLFHPFRERIARYPIRVLRSKAARGAIRFRFREMFHARGLFAVCRRREILIFTRLRFVVFDSSARPHTKNVYRIFSRVYIQATRKLDKLPIRNAYSLFCWTGALDLEIFHFVGTSI